jgi:hypothetical protein
MFFYQIRVFLDDAKIANSAKHVKQYHDLFADVRQFCKLLIDYAEY